MKIVWTIYLVLMSLQFLGTVAASVVIGPLHYFDVINCGFLLTALVVLFGYIYDRKPIPIAFTKLFVPAIVIWDLFFLFYWLPSSRGEEVLQLNPIMIFVFILSVPEYFAIYKYSSISSKEL